MVKVDLITGFLGSGKTTFIRKYADYLQRQGLKISVIENEFGGASVDSILLKNEDYNVKQIAGGCMCCSAKASFQNLLLDAATEKYDRILVEPSGIYDVDEFFDVMLNEPVKDSCEIGNILTIIDAHFDAALSDEAKYLMFSQLFSAGKIIFSKTQLFPEETTADSLNQINLLMSSHGSCRVFDNENCCMKDWDTLSDDDFSSFYHAGFQMSDHEREFMQHAAVFTARVMAGLCENAVDLEERIHRLMNSSDYGTILRIKGFISDVNRNWYEINCSLDGFYIKPADIKKGLFIVIGQDLNDDALKTAFIPRR